MEIEIKSETSNEEGVIEEIYREVRTTLSPLSSLKKFDLYKYLILIMQIISIIMYGLFTTYSFELSGKGGEGVSNTISEYYPMYQDVHVMIFIGFGFLMTFLKKYCFSGIGLNFLIASFTIQYAILINGFFHNVFKYHWEKISLDITSLITGDFACGAVLITFGAVLGKISIKELILMIPLELIFYSVNESLGVEKLLAVDMGGSMYVHTFGAYFGLALSYMISNKNKFGSHVDFESDRNTDLFAMIGSIFLWIYWPSFNGTMATGNSQHRVVINTVLSLTNSCIGAFCMSKLLRPNKKLSMVDIQNATLAGGVAVGSSADLVIGPCIALIIGLVSGSLSVIGYIYIQPCIEKKLNIHDTCGVHNLHGMPGIIGGLAGFISASVVSDEVYGDNISKIFPGRGIDRNAPEQGAYQLSALVITVLISITGGLFTGYILKNLKIDQKKYVDDLEDWNI